MKLRYLFVSLISLVIGMVIGNTTIPANTNVIYYPYYKTPAHVGLNNAWVNIYRDDANDIAYYTVSSDMTDFTVPKNGEEITFLNQSTGIIDEMSPYGFNVKVEQGVAQHGMSGTPCFNEQGEVVGYVSAAIGTQHIYCIWR